MFEDAWRMMRDYFYDRDLHKVNWQLFMINIEPLVARINRQDELDNLLARWLANYLHCIRLFLAAINADADDNIQTGFLGATFTKTTKGLRIDHIYKSDPDYPDFSSPLNKPELQIKEGDIITSINNVPVKDESDMDMLLANKVQQPVKLSLLDKTNKAYDQVVKPCSARDAFTLRYEEWELMNREKVDSMSNNDIGYIHLKAMTGT